MEATVAATVAAAARIVLESAAETARICTGKSFKRLSSALQPIGPIKPNVGPPLIFPDKELSDKPTLGQTL